MRLVCPEESLYADNLSVVGELLVSEGRFKRERRGVLKSKFLSVIVTKTKLTVISEKP